MMQLCTPSFHWLPTLDTQASNAVKHAYEIFPEGDRDYSIRAMHARAVMGVDCPKCGVWATTGMEYPSVGVSGLNDIIPRCHFYGSRKSEPMSVEFFREIENRLAPILGPDRPFVPGTRFGPLKGKAVGKTDDDFVWLHRWTLLVREPVYRAIKDAGFDVNGVVADIAFKQEPREKLIELEGPPSAGIHPSPPFRICGLCGRNPTIRGREKEFAPSVALQRIRDWPTRILINEAFADFVMEQGFTGVDWKKIDAIAIER